VFYTAYKFLFDDTGQFIGTAKVFGEFRVTSPVTGYGSALHFVESDSPAVCSMVGASAPCATVFAMENNTGRKITADELPPSAP
jgi:hypothetical protein